ncbi:hypothetical protein PHLGIDRAFT_128507 [Phlebiopsis gigantea 11061_1 CR5-6]|uniref:Elongin-A n=1 Tax=Phlebiopsis gigantea (strain 11061_1 CR5-6) TaxID=745531 RepID=A0A0C3PIZ5_PHLG1|nr:hypothetical protein PHLGIDRAFT_128507 [Phlebiopsis gigantea 11061_1 CR5-6]
MPHPEPAATSRVPTLVSLCQRVASAHVESMCSLGEDAPFALLQPILQNCSAHALLRFEQATPALAHDTADLWKALCFRAFPLPAGKRNAGTEPESWRDEYFILQDLEAKRLEAVGLKLRIQREEFEQRRKDSQIKITDKLPPPKRFRGGWGQQAPRTLIQKTRVDAVKMQKGIYGTRMLPAMPATKSFRTLSSSTSKPRPPNAAASLAGPSTGTSGTRITVSTVSKMQQPPHAATASAKGTAPATNAPPSVPARAAITRTPSTTAPSGTAATSVPRATQSSPPPIGARPDPLKPPIGRKDPMSSLFMPKHRAYSQLRTPSSTMRSRA